LADDGKGVLFIQENVNNVKIYCNCSGRYPVRWFSPGGKQVPTVYNVPNGAPFFKRGYERNSAIIIIPTFNYSYAGTYTCGVGTSFPPSPIVITNLSKCK